MHKLAVYRYSFLLYKLSCILLLCGGMSIPETLNGQFLSFLDFQNTSIGVGINRTNYSFSYPEVPRFYNNTLKQSFVIDIRTNFSIPNGFRFSPLFELWSWTDNSGKRYNVIQNGANDYLFSFDITRPVTRSKRLTWYLGSGVGIHFFTYWTIFPRFSSQYNYQTRFQIRSITEHKVIPAPDYLTGFEFYFWEGFYISTEIRYENNQKLNQWKYIISISMF